MEASQKSQSVGVDSKLGKSSHSNVLFRLSQPSCPCLPLA